MENVGSFFYFYWSRKTRLAAKTEVQMGCPRMLQMLVISTVEDGVGKQRLLGSCQLLMVTQQKLEKSNLKGERKRI